MAQLSLKTIFKMPEIEPELFTVIGVQAPFLLGYRFAYFLNQVFQWDLIRAMEDLPGEIINNKGPAPEFVHAYYSYQDAINQLSVFLIESSAHACFFSKIPELNFILILHGEVNELNLDLESVITEIEAVFSAFQIPSEHMAKELTLFSDKLDLY